MDNESFFLSRLCGSVQHADSVAWLLVAGLGRLGEVPVTEHAATSVHVC